MTIIHFIVLFLGMNFAFENNHITKAELKELNVDDVTIGCGDSITEITEPGTILTSPNYPEKYPNNQDCRTVIRFAEGERISLEFLSFDLEDDSRCDYDWLAIHDGNDSNSKHLGAHLRSTSRLCGKTLPPYMVSSKNKLFLHFHSDAYSAKSGFKVQIDIDETKCQHNDHGATDSRGNGCVDFYEDYSEYRCGDYDDDDFTALEMCCTCKTCSIWENGGEPKFECSNKKCVSWIVVLLYSTFYSF